MFPSRFYRYITVLIGVVTFFVIKEVESACPNLCNGHGRCIEVNRCECFQMWTGGDCSLRKCPIGTAWADVAVKDDKAHQPSECSNRGHCDYKTGECLCMHGYEGAACERMICPADCDTHGQCHSMRHHANTVDKGTLRIPSPYTNVRSAFTYRNNWDADMIHGCTCDSGFDSWDCADRRCVHGDDPMTTGQPDEVQLLRCDIDPTDPTYTGPQFTLSFRGAVTRPISPSASPADLKDYLEELPTIGIVEIIYTSGGVTLCDASFNGAGSNSNTQPVGSNIVMIRFLSEHGDLPTIIVLDQKGKPLYGAKDNLIFTAGKGDTLVRTLSLNPVSTEVIASVTGTKEDIECSGRGICNKGTGICQCFTGFTSSNALGDKGTIPDCGYPYLPITSCPGVGIECSGHGTCSGNPSYKCSCYDGWTNGDCSLRLCPSGKAWFDYPIDVDTAHGIQECSNKGSCNRQTGRCECQDMFEGEACERMTCPGKTSPLGVCSGHGRCLSMNELAEYNSDNGDPSPHTYGNDPNQPATWDAESVYGCLCDSDWTGYDCSLRTCPVGNDITLLEADVSRLDEAQRIDCAILDGTNNPTFTLSFRGATTVPLLYTATAAEVETALEALPTIEDIEVIYRGNSNSPPDPDNFCLSPPSPGSTGQEVTFYFHTEHGDVPVIRLQMDEASKDPITGEYGFAEGFLGTELEFTGGDPSDNYVSSFTYQKTPVYPATGIRAREMRKGKSGNVECSGRGICNRDNGICQCFLGFGASNDNRGPGGVENCGWREPYVAPKLQLIDRPTMQQITALHKAIDNLRSHATELVQRFKHADNDEETSDPTPRTPDVSVSSSVPSSSSSFIITSKDILQSTRLLGDIKGNNRAVTLTIEAAQQYVEKSSNSADANHLLLQNLLYEKAHLIREIQKCADYPTPEFDRIHFVGFDELIKATPELQNYVTKNNTKNNNNNVSSSSTVTIQDFTISEHTVNRYRLNHELQLRKQMEVQVEEQKQKLASLRQKLQEKRAILDSIPNYMKDYEKMITPLATKLGIDNITNSGTLSRYNRAINLPRPLYTLYNHMEGLIQLSTTAVVTVDSTSDVPLYVIDTTDAVTPMMVTSNDSAAVSRVTIPVDRFRLYGPTLGLSSTTVASGSLITLIDNTDDSIKLASSSPLSIQSGTLAHSVHESSIGRKRPRTEDSGLPHIHHTSTHHFTTANDQQLEEMDGLHTNHHSSSLLMEENGSAPIHEAQYVSLPLSDVFRPHPQAVMLGMKLSSTNPSVLSSTTTTSSSSSLPPSSPVLSIVGIRFQYYPLLDIVTATPVGAGDAGAVTVQSMFQKYVTVLATGTPAVTLSLASVPHHSLINLNSNSDNGKWDSRYIQLCAIGNDTPINSTTVLASTTTTGTLSSPGSNVRKQYLNHLSEHDIYASKVLLPFLSSKHGEGSYYWIHSLTGSTHGIPPPHYYGSSSTVSHTFPSAKTILQLMYQRLSTTVALNTQLSKLTRNPSQLGDFILPEFRSYNNNLYNYCTKLITKLQGLQNADVASLHKIGGEPLGDLQPLLPLVTNMFSVLAESSVRFPVNSDQLATIISVTEMNNASISTPTATPTDETTMDTVPSRMIHVLYSFTIPKGNKPVGSATSTAPSTSSSNAYIALTFALILYLPIGFPSSNPSVTARLIPISATNVTTPGVIKTSSSSTTTTATNPSSSIRVPSTPNAITMAQTMGASLLANLDIVIGGVTKKEEISHTLQKFINLWCLSLPLFTSSSASLVSIFPHSLYVLTHLLPALIYTSSTGITNPNNNNNSNYSSLVKQFFTSSSISAMDTLMSSNNNELPKMPSFHYE